jgi:hypothetical protein
VLPRNRRATFATALCVAALTLPQGASAQTPPPVASPPAMGPDGMSMSEWQGASCLWAGVLGSAAVFYYSDVLTIAATGATNPVLLVPLMVTGFLGGCSVGANGSPGLTWLYRHM